jgi:hypothetical protein
MNDLCSDLRIRMVGQYHIDTAKVDETCSVCGDPDWGDVLINGVCGRCWVKSTTDMFGALGRMYDDIVALRDENEKLKAEISKLLNWQFRVLQTMNNCHSGDCSCGSDEDCQALFREATEKGGE